MAVIIKVVNYSAINDRVVHNMVHFIEALFYLNLFADALIFIIAPGIFLLLKK